MVTIQLPKDFKEFLALLNLNQVKYLVVGGYAVVLHGYPRATGDIDIWVDRNINNAKKLVKVLSQFGFNPKELSENLFLQENRIIRMGMPPIRIELLTSASGIQFDICFKHRKVQMVDGIKINFINLKYLKENKKNCHRLKDLNDLENLP